VWGPARVPSINGYRYYISFVDDATQHVALYYMKTKDEAPEKVKHYLTYIKRQGEKYPKAVRADNGCENVNNDLIGWCHTKGIELQTTVLHTPEQNGITERWNRTVVELSRAMLLAHRLPSELWPEAMTYATYIQNRAYTRAIPDMTPYQKWTGNKPDISHIHEFGHAVWVLDEQINPSKLEPNAYKHIFVGLQEGPRAIKYFDTQKKTIKVSRNYRYPRSVDPNMASHSRFEGEKRDNSHSHKPDSNTAQEGVNNKQKYISEETTKNTRLKTNKDIEKDNDPNEELPDLDDDPDEDEYETSLAAHVYMAFNKSNLGNKDPKTLKEAMRSPDWPEWEKAVNAELMTLEQMGTWELADAPENRKPITNKWVFVKKYNKEGDLQKYKARLVARGFSQIPGMDYDQTFAPVVRLETIRAILALAIENDWEIQQMDVKGTYLNGDLKEEIYMNQPEGFDDGTSRLCRLIKTLYGLKQSGQEWNHKLDSKLTEMGFERLQSDPCVYIRKTNGIEIITVWVDDLLLFTNSKDRMDILKREIIKSVRDNRSRRTK
jgi:hypothetical protein